MRTWIWLVTTGGTGRMDTAQFLPRTAAGTLPGAAGASRAPYL